MELAVWPHFSFRWQNMIHHFREPGLDCRSSTMEALSLKLSRHLFLFIWSWPPTQWRWKVCSFWLIKLQTSMYYALQHLLTHVGILFCAKCAGFFVSAGMKVIWKPNLINRFDHINVVLQAWFHSLELPGEISENHCNKSIIQLITF